MADTAHKDPESLKEHFDSPDVLEKKSEELVKLIKEAKHFTVFTGAGVSTSAGIPDFRGPQGVWTLQAQGKKRTEPTVSTLKAIPTPTHMALVKLQSEGILKYLISQNVDGLHRRSGILPEKISELHGNSNLEQCHKCGKEYLRDFNASASYRYSVHDHRTGRKCDVCGSELYDTIINFGENLPKIPLQRAWEHTEKSDLMLVLGSSLTVSPACLMPEKVTTNGMKLVICNLQKTPLDSLATIRIFAKCDDLMKLVMKKLGYEIPTFILTRYLLVEKEGKNIKISGVDVDNIPVTFIRAVVHNKKVFEEEPFKIQTKQEHQNEVVQLHFMGHYNEPPLDVNIPIHQHDYKVVYKLNFNPMTGIWTIDYPKEFRDDKELNLLLSSLHLSDSQKQNKVKYKILIGNTHRQIENPKSENKHEWTVYVKGVNGSDLTDVIDKVTFELHHTFVPSLVTVNSAPFNVTRIGWRTFTIPVIIHFKNGTIFEAKHHLSFDTEDTSQMFEVDLQNHKRM